MSSLPHFYNMSSIFKAISHHHSKGSPFEPLRKVQRNYFGQLISVRHLNIFYIVPILHKHLQLLMNILFPKFEGFKKKQLKLVTMNLDSRVYNWITHILWLVSNLILGKLFQ